MQPAYSVIFFTVSSGIGFGMLIIAGAFALLCRLPEESGLALSAMVLALAAIAAGLVSSTLHLGHPERTWRAFSQWRTSWLSREGVLAVACFPPAIVFGWIWAFGGPGWLLPVTGALTALLALATVAATGMIYQSLPTIRAWSQPLVTPVFILLSLATGSLWLAALVAIFSPRDSGAVLYLPLFVLSAAWIAKACYWRRLDRPGPGGPTPATATGLGGTDGHVRLLEAPHTQENFVMREMGYRVARRHAARLRRWAQGLAFLASLALTGAALLLPEGMDMVRAALAFAAAASATAGVLVERWLFFAEARHVVTLYYGADSA